MIKKIFIYSILICGVFHSCLNMTEPEIQAGYIDCRNCFDTSLVRFIPKKIPNNSIGFGFRQCSLDNLRNSEDIKKYAGIELMLQFQDKQKYSDLIMSYKRKALYQGDLNDSCILIIRTEDEQYQIEYLNDNSFKLNRTKNKQDKIKYSNYCNSIPIPQYAMNSIVDTNEQIENNKLLVLDFDYKDILNRNIAELRKDLPNKYAAGYSTGLTYNDIDMTINYWLIIW